MHPATKVSQAKHGQTKPLPKSAGGSLDNTSPVRPAPKTKGKRKKDDPNAERKSIARARFIKAANSIRAFIRFQKALSLKPSDRRRPNRSSAATVRLENTYRTEPEEDERFKSDACKNIVEDLVKERLERYTYDKGSAPKIARALTASVTDSLKAKLRKTAPRYKIICNVIIGQSQGQGLSVSSRAVWNDATDSYISYNYTKSDLFAVAIVHAVYMD